MRFACIAMMVMVAGCTPKDPVPEAEPKAEAPTPSDETTKIAAPLRASPPALRPFAPKAKYGGVIHLPSSSRVIRDRKGYKELVAEIPKNIVTKGPRKRDKSQDPLLAMPEIDFERHMLVVGVCSSFYCKYEFEGYELQGTTMTVHARRGEEREMTRYAQRPVRQGGKEAVGHYRALVIERVATKVVFQEKGLKE